MGKAVIPDKPAGNGKDKIHSNVSGMVAILDEAIGNITNLLENNGYMDNLLLIFTTDVRLSTAPSLQLCSRYSTEEHCVQYNSDLQKSNLVEKRNYEANRLRPTRRREK